ncbi:MAG: sigma-70 family RNA polymerase sigma factor [Clostridia bacterium]|nr:sigma-70 family RNA polymerase sigma factor [Clostridia bacterium]
MPDSTIIRLFWERKEEAITQMSEKYGHLCLHTARNIVGNQEDAEECVNESYYRIWNVIPPQKPNPLLGFLLKIVRNISINRYHYNTAQRRSSSYDVCLEELSYCVPAKDTVESEYDVKQLATALDTFLDSLGETDRMLFVRRYWYMDSFESLSSLSGMKEGALRTRLFRIRTALKKFLQERGVPV